MRSRVIREERGGIWEGGSFRGRRRGCWELKLMWDRHVEGNFRTLLLDGDNQVLTGGEAMLFPTLGIGAFYPDKPDMLERVSLEARYLLQVDGSWESIRNCRSRKPVAYLPYVYFDWAGTALKGQR